MKRLMTVWMLVLMAACSSGGSGECNSSGDCGAGRNCTDLMCVACGAPGQQCCNPPGALEPTCNTGLTCLEGMPRTCQACGGAGQACCTGDDTTRACGMGLTCSSGTCIGGSTACEPGSSPMTIPVGIVDSNTCGVRVISVASSSFEDAKRCAETMLGAGELVRAEALPPEGLRAYEVCVNRRGMRTDRAFNAFSDGDARLCACGGSEMLFGCVVTWSACGS